MNYRYEFTLINETLGSYELNEAPEGWDDLDVILQRSEEFHAVNREVPATTNTY